MLALHKAIERMNRNELELEELLEDDDIIQDIKTNPSCQLAPL
jgi:hypothetical protein